MSQEYPKISWINARGRESVQWAENMEGMENSIAWGVGCVEEIGWMLRIFDYVST